MSKSIRQLLLEAGTHHLFSLSAPKFPESEVRTCKDFVKEYHVMHNHAGRKMLSVHFLHYGITVYITDYNDGVHPVDIYEHMNFKGTVDLHRLNIGDGTDGWSYEFWVGGTNEDNMSRVRHRDDDWQSIVLHPSGSFTEGELDNLCLGERLPKSGCHNCGRCSKSE